MAPVLSAGTPDAARLLILVSDLPPATSLFPSPVTTIDQHHLAVARLEITLLQIPARQAAILLLQVEVES